MDQWTNPPRLAASPASKGTCSGFRRWHTRIVTYPSILKREDTVSAPTAAILYYNYYVLDVVAKIQYHRLEYLLPVCYNGHSIKQLVSSPRPTKNILLKLSIYFILTEHERRLDVRQPRPQRPDLHLHPVPVHHTATLAHWQGYWTAVATCRYVANS